MYISVFSHIVDCLGFIYTDIVVSCVHELIGTIGFYVPFQRHKCSWYMTIAGFLSHGVDAAINDRVAFVMLG